MRAQEVGGLTLRRVHLDTLLDDAKEYVVVGTPKDMPGFNSARIAFRGTYDEAAAYAERNESPDNYERYHVSEVIA